MRLLFRNINNIKLYKNVIEYMCEKSSYIGVSTFKWYHKNKLNDTYFNFLNLMEKYRVSNDIVKLPKSYMKGQKFHIAELSEELKVSVKKVKDLSCWMPPDYPEDLTFYLDKIPWCYFITHENMLYLDLFNNELMQILVELSDVRYEVIDGKYYH